MNYKHPLICVEGIDASGKATISAYLAEQMKADLFSFPMYHTEVGQAIKKHLRGEWDAVIWNTPEEDHECTTLNAIVRQSLMTANRCEAQDLILAALDAGPVVLDRYVLSAYAYGAAEGLELAWLKHLSAPLLKPDLTIVLDIPPKLVSKRRPEARDANESNYDLLQRARSAYLGMASMPGVEIVNADAPLEHVKAVALDLAQRVE